MATKLEGVPGDGIPLYDLLYAADRVAAAAMWLVVHLTYAKMAPLNGRSLMQHEFKEKPEGHTGGSLNMVPAYVGYLAANALAGRTRSWVMGQGHCVAAIDSVNLLTENMEPGHSTRYGFSEEGLSRFVQDFYSYRLGSDGKPESTLGSHVNAHTAGGMVEGGYLGFTELQYVHMPLPGETLVAFLSDGAWEEQRGSDWAPRWWRAEDSGYALPVMIHNGRRIDQRTMGEMGGGPSWLHRHLELNHFDPIEIDGRDPAAFVWAICEMEERLRGASGSGVQYPVRLPYSIAVAPKGAGFAGEGTNDAHNLPLGENPYEVPAAAQRFNESARRLWVPESDLKAALHLFQSHGNSERVKERSHSLAHRSVQAQAPAVEYSPAGANREDPEHWELKSPMAAIDAVFLAYVQANPGLRPRVGNPDEMSSNRMTGTLEALKFRVTDPEPGRPEDVHGAIVSALNEEAIAAAAVGNKGGINLIVTYEAFAEKMHGMLRQEVTFSNGLTRAGSPPGWLSVPLVLTSQTWENGKNEYSHQDTTMCEAMLAEPAHVSRVVFPADYNSAAAALSACYATHGQIWTIVVPKGELPGFFSPEEAEQLIRDGAAPLEWLSYKSAVATLTLIAVGGYQLREVVKACERLRAHEFAHRVVYLAEPARLRVSRSRRETAHVLTDEKVEALFPSTSPARVLLSHTRPEPLLGVLSRIHTGQQTVGLGFHNDGGTLDVPGMLWVNGCSWAHCLRAASRVTGQPESVWLTAAERRALDGQTSPEEIIRWMPKK